MFKNINEMESTLWIHNILKESIITEIKSKMNANLASLENELDDLPTNIMWQEICKMANVERRCFLKVIQDFDTLDNEKKEWCKYYCEDDF